jgi:hypothetical protein
MAVRPNFMICFKCWELLGHPTWNPRGRNTAATGVPHTYEELSTNGGCGTCYDDNPPVPPHAHSDDSSLYSKPPNGGNKNIKICLSILTAFHSFLSART